MDEKQKKWTEQYGSNFGAKEFLRFSCALMTLLIVGIGLGLAFKNAGIIVIFIVLFFGTLWLAPYWQPAYSIVHRIMGNPNIPVTLPKYQRKWWHYIPIAIKVFLLLVVLRLGVQLLLQ
ncbi:MAG TPA: hypothetical protein VJ821_10105 [Anaerolineales bacterium]|nr:hypothetical protein [Anaerolineales bacterium]